ncbi:hypothetical protein FRE64_07110 [Euhalothece natronophila Z-M001]|uniref:Uncharacterized protein n=1 Tax=Euhalothece natronophila Z-M001 TaxID=522448 RepID=A0A5B8NL48_9CHRO|nr:hypothetical protein [Euhalothece natronophila]QDZ39726.1 hypothetical protein FRE64_07110 [Euhalothece natronophila Z-M001]
MSNFQVDLTGLTPEQISQVQAFIERLKQNSQNEAIPETSQKDEDEKLQQLHQEFDWLVADIGIKNSLHRSDIYGINS